MTERAIERARRNRNMFLILGIIIVLSVGVIAALLAPLWLPVIFLFFPIITIALAGIIIWTTPLRLLIRFVAGYFLYINARVYKRPMAWGLIGFMFPILGLISFRVTNKEKNFCLPTQECFTMPLVEEYQKRRMGAGRRTGREIVEAEYKIIERKG